MDSALEIEVVLFKLLYCYDVPSDQNDFYADIYAMSLALFSVRAHALPCFLN